MRPRLHRAEIGGETGIDALAGVTFRFVRSDAGPFGPMPPGAVMIAPKPNGQTSLRGASE